MTTNLSFSLNGNRLRWKYILIQHYACVIWDIGPYQFRNDYESQIQKSFTWEKES